MPLLETLQDDFSSVDPAAHWQWYANGAENSGGVLVLPAAEGIWANARTEDEWTLEGSHVLIEVPQVIAADGASGAYLRLAVESGVDGTVLEIRYWAADDDLQSRSTVSFGDGDQITAPYDPLEHRWWRIRETNGTVFWETSSSGLNWTTQRSADTPAWVQGATTLGVILEAFRDSGATDAGHMDNLNLPPDPPGAVLRSNTCDGPDGVAVTTGNSGGSLGDAWDGTTGPLLYSNTAVLGGGSIRFEGDSDPIGMVWANLSLTDMAARGYLRRDPAAQNGHIWWWGEISACSLFDGGGLTWPTMDLALPEGTIPENHWCRVEFQRAGDQGTLSVWSTDPHSLGAPDATTTGTVPTTTVTQMWWERTFPGGIWWDELAINDTSDPIGPAMTPPPPLDPPTIQRIGWGRPVYYLPDVGS